MTRCFTSDEFKGTRQGCEVVVAWVTSSSQGRRRVISHAPPDVSLLSTLASLCNVTAPTESLCSLCHGTRGRWELGRRQASTHFLTRWECFLSCRPKKFNSRRAQKNRDQYLMGKHPENCLRFPFPTPTRSASALFLTKSTTACAEDSPPA